MERKKKALSRNGNLTQNALGATSHDGKGEEWGMFARFTE
jgi:hypothetical protein